MHPAATWRVHPFPDLAGYRVLGRQGALGAVVDGDGVVGEDEDATVIVRGGVSDALLYYVPAKRLVSISFETRTVTVAVDEPGSAVAARAAKTPCFTL